MFDDELTDITATTAPRRPALLPGLKWRAAFRTTTPVTPLVVMGLFFLLFLVTELSTSWQIRHSLGSAAYTDAIVSDVTDDGRLRQTEIIYKFRTTDGRDFSGRASVDREYSRYARTKPLESVPVEFIVENPWENRLVETSRSGGWIVLFIFPIIFLGVFIGPFFTARFLRVFRDRTIFRSGQITNGTVTFIKPAAVFIWWGWSNPSTAEVFVRFAGADGTTYEARALCQNDWLIRHLAPGTPVHISYLPRRPTRAMLLDAYVR